MEICLYGINFVDIMVASLSLAVFIKLLSSVGQGNTYINYELLHGNMFIM